MGKLRTTDGFKGLSTHLQWPTTLKVKRRHRHRARRCTGNAGFRADLQEIPINFLSAYVLDKIKPRWTFLLRDPLDSPSTDTREKGPADLDMFVDIIMPLSAGIGNSMERRGGGRGKRSRIRKFYFCTWDGIVWLSSSDSLSGSLWRTINNIGHGNTLLHYNDKKCM